MDDDLNFIVRRLNSEPFNLSIRAVEFEQKTPDELLQLLIDIVSSLDDRVKADVSVESKDEVIERLFHFLSMHKYKLLPNKNEFHSAEWMDGIGKGQHTVSILCWVLRNYDNLKKRVYLANYLQPINVPEEYLNQSDSNLAELVETYNDLQADFVDLHKEFERVSSSNGPSANDLLRDLDRMKAEKHRLVERLEREHKQARGNTKFELLLKEVSRLRELNDKEIGLYEQRQQQHDIMSLAKKRLEQVHLLSNTLQDVSNDPSEIEKAINHSIIEYEKKIAQRHNEIELKLVQTDNSHQDCEEINKTVVNLEDELERKLSELDELKQEFDLEKLRPFQQHVDASTAKLQSKQEEFKAKQMERALAESNLEKLRTTLEESTANEHVQELQQFHQELMNQTRIYEKAKQEVQAMHERNAELRETEQRLTKELNEVEALQNEEEEQAGVTGFRDVNAELEKASKDTMSLNERKSQTLAEISSTVQRIALVLEAKQKELEPKVQDLKTARAQYQEFTERYDYEKKAYQELEQKSKADNEGLEKESAKLQDELAEKEKQYSEICASNKILQANINCCTSDSLNNLEAKVTEQEQLLNDLRKQHDGMKGREEFSSSQKVMISNLIKLLELKAQCIG